MLTIRKILFPTDFSACAGKALEPAMMLAHVHGASLHMLHVVAPSAEMAESADHALRDGGARRGEPDATATIEKSLVDLLSVRTDVVIDAVPVVVGSGSPSDAILRYVESEGVDVVVMGTHGRTGIHRFILGSVAERVVRLSGCPVVTVKGSSYEAAPRRILVAVDFSEYGRLAVLHATEMAASFGARLDLLHVVQETHLPGVYGVELPLLAVPEIQERSREALTVLARSVSASVEWQAHVSVGHPAREIVQSAAGLNSDMIVMATHGLTGLQHAIIGSVAEKVVRTAECPVFTVRSSGRSLIGHEATADLQSGDGPSGRSLK